MARTGLLLLLVFVSPAGAEPVVELIRAQPELKASMITFAIQLPYLAQTPLASLQSLQAVSALDPALALGIPKAAATQEGARLTLGLLAHPEFVAAHRAELAAVIGEPRVAAFEAASPAFRRDAAAALGDIGRAVDLSGARGAEELAARANRAFDQSRLALAGAETAVAEPSGAAAARRPPAALERYDPRKAELFDGGNWEEVPDREVYGRFIKTGANGEGLSRLAAAIFKSAGLPRSRWSAFASYFNGEASGMLIGSRASSEPPPELRLALEDARAAEKIRALLALGQVRPAWLMAEEARVLDAHPGSASVKAMLDELWVVEPRYYEKTLHRLAALPAQDRLWAALEHAEARGRRTRAVDRASLLFPPEETRRWTYRPAQGILTADDAVEYVERISDLNADYLDGRFIYHELQPLRERFERLSPGALVDGTNYTEERLAGILFDGRMQKLFKAGSLSRDPAIVAWIARTIRDRKEFDADFRAALDARIRARYPTPP
jgi:hypothetical protein